MTDKQITDWKQDAQDTLAKFDPDRHTKESFMLYGAALAILGDDSRYRKDKSELPKQDTPNKTLREIIEDELSDAEKYYKMGEREIAMDEIRHADRFLADLKSQAVTPDDKNYLHAVIERRNLIASKL